MSEALNEHPDQQEGLDKSSTLLDSLVYNVTNHPDHVLLRWVGDSNCEVTQSLTYEILWQQSDKVARLLTSKGVVKGDRVMIAYPFGLEFLTGFFGCMRIGAIPCSVYPPNPTDGKQVYSFDQFNNQVKDAGAKFALTTAKFRSILQLTYAKSFGKYSTAQVEWLSTDTIKSSSIKDATFTDIISDPHDIAFIQYSSGSTGDPKGIMISHGAIMHNINTIFMLYRAPRDQNSLLVTWLPQYHDYALINAILLPVCNRKVSSVLFSPVEFVRNPIMWAETIEKFEATHTAGPNFAYSLLAKRMQTKKRVLQAPKLIWASMAAEPIDPHTIKKMVDIGFPRQCIAAAYGLAESCVYVTSANGDEIRTLDGVVSCGKVARNESAEKYIATIDKEGNIIQDGSVGEICVCGPDLASGYWNKPELTQDAFHTRLNDGREYFRTGDTGRIVDGYLFVTGRIKELIIVNGKNVYPTDIERTLEKQFPNLLRPGCTVAFQLTDTDIGIVMELRQTVNAYYESKELNEQTVQRLVANAFGVHVGKCILLNHRTVPKTTSGKLRRVETRTITMENKWSGKSIIWQSSKRMGGEQSSTFGVPSHLDESFLNLPINSVPEGVEKAAMSVECNFELLDLYFQQLHLNDVPGIADEWAVSPKSTDDLRQMCRQSLDALARDHPTICQMAHALEKRPDWIFLRNGKSLKTFLVEVVHCAYVLQWVTMKMIECPGRMRAKLASDTVHEETILATTLEKNGFEAGTVPEELQQVLGLKGAKDPLLGNLDFFWWIKYRSVTSNVLLYLEPFEKEPTGQLDQDRVTMIAMLNILEAVWVDSKRGYGDNADVGRWLAAQRIESITFSGYDAQVVTEVPEWYKIYIAWNLSFVARNTERWLTDFHVAKLLLPCIVAGPATSFHHARSISLYLAVQQGIRRRKWCDNDKSTPEPGILSSEATRLFGHFNNRWLSQLDFTGGNKSPVSVSSAKDNQDCWLSKFYEWSGTEAGIEEHSIITSDNQTSGFDSKVDRVFHAVLGSCMDSDKSWENNGLTSLTHIELIDAVSNAFFVELPVSFPTIYPTPAALKAFILGRAGAPFETDLPELEGSKKNDETTNNTNNAVQAVGVLVQFLVLTLSLIAAYMAGREISSIKTTKEIGSSGRFFIWYWFPFVVPTFMGILSLMVLVLKWIIIGKYQPKEVVIPSTYFLRWWFVDRLIHLWEFWVGRLVLDTPFIWLFYWLMGARIHPLSKIDAFVREFDLVTVGKGASICHYIRCRKFGPWDDTYDAPSLRFRPIVIGENSIIKGMVGPGSNVGNGSLVSHLCVLSEGSQVPNQTVAKSNPAFNAGQREFAVEDNDAIATSSWTFHLMKFVWLMIELYIFFTTMLVGQVIWNGQLPGSWRYTPLLYWILLLVTSWTLSILVSVILKWTLIGRRKAISHVTSMQLLQRFCLWACDYHFDLTIGFIECLVGPSRVLNLILMAHGLDIDLTSCLSDGPSFKPSGVDQIKIKRSFVSTRPSFDEGEKIEIIDSSLGFRVHVGSGVKIHRSAIRPLASIEESLYDDHVGKDFVVKGNVVEFIVLELFCLLYFGLICLSLIPSFEFFNFAVLNVQSVGIAIPALALTLLVQFAIWIVLLRVFQSFTLLLKKGNRLYLADSCYFTYIYMSFSVNGWCQWSMLYGTPFFPMLLRFMGCKVEDRLLYFGRTLHDYYDLTFEDKTIIDECQVTGHHLVGNNLTIGPSVMTGVLHQGCFIIANTNMHGKVESGPWSFIYGEQTNQGFKGKLTKTKEQAKIDVTDINEESDGALDV